MGHRNITIIVMVGVFGFLLGSFGINSSNTDNSLQTDSVMALGHLQLILKDADGNIKQYQQTDNLITNQGLNTMADFVFGIDLNNNLFDDHFTVIGIGLSSNGVDATFGGLQLPKGTCLNATATVSEENFAVLPSVKAEVLLNATFTGADGCNDTFFEAVIQNDLTDGEALTRQIFSAITLGSGDLLDVDWIIGFG